MSEVQSKVVEIIIDKLGVKESEVVPEASFTNHLGADSLDTPLHPKKMRDERLL